MVLCLFYLSIPVYLFVMPEASRDFMPLFPFTCSMTRVLNARLPFPRVPLLLLIFCLVIEFLFLLPAILYYPYITRNDNA